MNKNREGIDNKKAKACVLGTGGFSLIEVLIALAIFTFIIGGIVMFSVNTIKANTKSQAMQESIDNARYAMDDLAKKIRTSSNVKVESGGKEIFFIDNKTLTKYCYAFDNNQMLVAGFKLDLNSDGEITVQASNLYDSIIGCSDFTKSYPVVGNSSNGKIAIDGTFEIMTTDISDNNNPHRGFVRIIIDMVYNDSGSPENRAEVHLQSGVSIADYGREDGFEVNATVATPPAP
jgi:prepilin-type N-terminal cleavage/methylation domain-containing protein